MIEFRIHGRGGQGSVSAAYLLAAAAFQAGYTCQAFPAFGAERRGAPVTAFARIDDKPINLRSQIQNPDYLIVQDDTLLRDTAITNGLKSGGAMLVNSRRSSEDVARAFGCKVKCIAATEMAQEVIGRPIPNTALLACLFTLTGTLPLDALVSAVRSRFSGETLTRNLTLIERVAGSVSKDDWCEMTDA